MIHPGPKSNSLIPELTLIIVVRTLDLCRETKAQHMVITCKCSINGYYHYIIILS